MGRRDNRERRPSCGVQLRGVMSCLQSGGRSIVVCPSDGIVRVGWCCWARGRWGRKHGEVVGRMKHLHF